MAQQTTPAPVASLPPPPPIPESRIVTTDQIQKYLDENKQLILTILDNQNMGKMSESAQFQAQLQRNLLFLAALADAQPQTKAIRAQMMPQGLIPQAQGVTVVQVQPISQQEPQNPASTDQPAAPTTADIPKASPSAEADAGPSPVPESQPKDQSASGGETKEASSDVSKSKEQEQK
ncbi:GRF1-interacting factor 2-like protein [Carex littledalei]|uniref:GRF1-interacting factor 2-like protein n=1 Tax=Carex littledalei TaxID=544730 RepID=A0A833QK49_9POAL|nr:GRF1-interacting factor 2-like protein [Carex littledalei]